MWYRKETADKMAGHLIRNRYSWNIEHGNNKNGSSTSETIISCFANRGCDHHFMIAVACITLRDKQLSSLRWDHGKEAQGEFWWTVKVPLSREPTLMYSLLCDKSLSSFPKCGSWTICIRITWFVCEKYKTLALSYVHRICQVREMKSQDLHFKNFRGI